MSKLSARLTFVSMMVPLLLAGCDNRDELRNIEEGRDNPPAIDASPPEEQN